MNNQTAIQEWGPLAASRKSALYTQNQFASKMGITKPTIISYEKDPDSVSISVLKKWYDLVNYDGKAIISQYLDDLFSRPE